MRYIASDFSHLTLDVWPIGQYSALILTTVSSSSPSLVLLRGTIQVRRDISISYLWREKFKILLFYDFGYHLSEEDRAHFLQARIATKQRKGFASSGANFDKDIGI